VKGRNLKSEIRRKAEIRFPRSEGQSDYGSELFARPDSWERAEFTKAWFGFQASAILRVSDLGFRILATVLSLLVLQLSFGAATNSGAPDEIPALRPPHGEIGPEFWEQYGWWVMLWGALLLALICAVTWLLTRPKPPEVVPPEVLARAALEPLRQQPEDGALLSRVSQILRHYVAAAFDLPPGELTTAECCRAIAGQGQIGPELSAALSGFLRQCDQRKFSPPPPAPPLSAVVQALQLIEQTQARRAALAQAATQTPDKPVANLSNTGVTQ
jgi:hypothetical protein